MEAAPSTTASKAFDQNLIGEFSEVNIVLKLELGVIKSFIVMLNSSFNLQ